MQYYIKYHNIILAFIDKIDIPCFSMYTHNLTKIVTLILMFHLIFFVLIIKSSYLFVNYNETINCIAL